MHLHAHRPCAHACARTFMHTCHMHMPIRRGMLKPSVALAPIPKLEERATMLRDVLGLSEEG